MNSTSFIDAIGQIDDRIITEVVTEMNYKEHKTHGKSYRRVIALAAALVLVLSLGAAAFALGWFGLSNRLTPVEEPSLPGLNSPAAEIGLLTMNGAADSNEAKASAAWQETYAQLLETQQLGENYNYEKWLDGLTEHAGEARAYTCFDEQTLDRLLAIAGEYGLKLHTRMATPITQEQFKRASGLERVLLDESGDFRGVYIFEDGSFKGDGLISVGGKDVSFGLNLSKAGVLAPYCIYVIDPGSYEEWQLEAEDYVLNLAMNASGDSALVLTQIGESFVTVNLRVNNSSLTREEVEQLAASFDYHAICSAKANLDVITDISAADSFKAKPKTGLLTVEEFIKTPEYLAGTAFKHAYGDHVDASGIYGEAYVKGQYYWCHYAPFPTGVEELDNRLGELQELYALRIPSGAQAIMAGSWTNPAYMTGPMSARLDPGGDVSDFKLGPATMDDYWALMGTENFLLSEEATPITSVLWDNGAWYSYFTYGSTGFDVTYVPKGSFCPVLNEFLHPDSNGWAYDTACGEQVYITLDGDIVYPRIPNASAIYETDTAYVILSYTGNPGAGMMQQFADVVDFGMFS